MRSHQSLVTIRSNAQDAAAPLATRRPNAKGLVVVLGRTRPPAEPGDNCGVKKHGLAKHSSPTSTPISSPTPSAAPSPTSVTASPLPIWFAEKNAAGLQRPSEHELCSRLVTALRAKAVAGHVLSHAELQFLGVSVQPSTVRPACRAAQSNCQAEPPPEAEQPGTLSSQPAAPCPPAMAPVAELRRHTYYNVTYCMRELSALHIR